ncbi:hypothetical protein [Aeromonas dhakensis]|uniref:hypothetical protein n=1 Tax=Aeromonas dhakensis TaxID=196024 RepID=UPI003B9E5372
MNDNIVHYCKLVKPILWLLAIFGYIMLANQYLFDFALSLKVDLIKSQIGILINVSAILFGVIGAWLALIYPTALQKAQGKENVGLIYSGVDLSVLKSLVLVLLFSTTALVTSLCCDLILTFSTHSLITSTISADKIKATCATIVWFLFFLQISAISSLLTSALKLVYDLFISKSFTDLHRLLRRKKTS